MGNKNGKKGKSKNNVDNNNKNGVNEIEDYVPSPFDKGFIFLINRNREKNV